MRHGKEGYEEKKIILRIPANVYQAVCSSPRYEVMIMQLDLIEKDTFKLLLREVYLLKDTQVRMQKSLFAKMNEIEKVVRKTRTSEKSDSKQLTLF